MLRPPNTVAADYLKTRRSLTRLALIAVAAAAGCLMASAAADSPTIAEFAHTAWGAREGAPRGVMTITQTTDGYIWLGATDGLFRFDGVAFERYEPPMGPELPNGSVSNLVALPNGDLWIGYIVGLAYLSKGRARFFNRGNGGPDGTLYNHDDFVRGPDGVMWIGTSLGLWRFNGDRWERIAKDRGYPGQPPDTLFVDGKGTLWIASGKSIFFLQKGSKIFQAVPVNIGPVYKFAEAPNGKLWMATEEARPVPLGDHLLPSDNVSLPVEAHGLLFDGEGGLWLGSFDSGIRRAMNPEGIQGHASAVAAFTAKNGLTDNATSAVFQDRERNIWVTTLGGLDRFRRSTLTPISTPDFSRYATYLVPGNRGDVWEFHDGQTFHIVDSRAEVIHSDEEQNIQCAFRNAAGEVWRISGKSIIRFGPGKPVRYSLPHELTGVRDLDEVAAFDGSGVLWIVRKGFGLFSLKAGIWKRLDGSTQYTTSTPNTDFTDSRGCVWFGFNDGTLLYLDHGKVHTIATPKKNAPQNGMWSIAGRAGRIWVGTDDGLFFFDGAQFHAVLPWDRERFDKLEGFDRPSGMIELADGSLWFCEMSSIIRIDSAEIQKFLANPSHRVHYQIFDSIDGLQGTFFDRGQKLVQGSDGRLWFGSTTSTLWLNPAALPTAGPLPIGIRSIVADGKASAPGIHVTIPPRPTNIQIGYDALNFSTPDRVRYRYKLEGVDKDWQDAGARREAFYTNLGPGEYRFYVTARNRGTEWNPAGAVLDFRVAPAWFQTIWFRVACAVTGLILLWMLYQLRLRQLHQQFSLALEARVDERTRIARELHDTLLQSFNALLLRFQGVSNLIVTRPDEARARVDRAIEQASVAIAEGRDAVHELRSVGLAGTNLAEAIGRFAQELLSQPSDGTIPEFHTEVEGTPIALNPIVRDEVYRVAAEALRNAIRHAQAKRIEAEIRYDEQQLRVRIRDDGKGIDQNILNTGHAHGHWGLSGMRERAKLAGGDLEVWSEPGSGTEVELTIPGASAYAKASASRWSVFSRMRRN